MSRPDADVPAGTNRPALSRSETAEIEVLEMTPVLLDILLLAVLALFAFFGWRKGLVLSLCGILAVFVAYFGATFISRAFSAEISTILQPMIQSQVEQVLSEGLTDQPPSSALPLMPGASSAQEDPVDKLTLDQALDALTKSPLFAGLQQSVAEAVRDGSLQVVTTAAAAISNYLAIQITQTVLFFLVFLLIQIAWWLFSRALDLAFQLPVLRTVNDLGGLLFGLIEGALLLIVVVWFLSAMNIVPAETVQATSLFRLFKNFQFF